MTDDFSVRNQRNGTTGWDKPICCDYVVSGIDVINVKNK